MPKKVIQTGDTMKTKIGKDWQQVTVHAKSNAGKNTWVVRTGSGNLIYREASQLRKNI